jgi:hypothetical protein
MRPFFLIVSFLLISCHQLPQGQTEYFFKKVHIKDPSILLIENTGIIPGNARFIKYPYWDTTTTIRFASLIGTPTASFVFFLGKNYITDCDICMSEKIGQIQNLSKAGNFQVLFITDNRDSREMAVFRNRHNIDKLYIFENPSSAIAQYDYTCFIAPTK